MAIATKRAPARKAGSKKVNKPTQKTPVMELPDRKTDRILLSEIRPSTFEPQARRRARFTEHEIADFAENIRQHGLVQAIVVRPLDTKKGPKYEIVAGERRFLAVTKLGAKYIDCTVQELTESEAFSIQMVENLQRKDPHPVDEAYNYEYMSSKLGLSDDEIALRVGQSVSYVANRRKLLTLDGKVLKAFESGEVLFGHALEISKYPADAQQYLLSLAKTDPNHRETGMYSVPKFVERIKEYYLRLLSRAPFSIKSTDLRPDGLACVSCPDRTGANATLFEDGTGKQDACLKPDCWNNKTQTFVQIQRVRIALPDFEGNRELSPGERKKVEAVPLVAGEYVYQGDPKPESFIRQHDYEEVKKGSDCNNGQVGVFFNGRRVGQKVHFCIDPNCKTHKGKYNVSRSSSSTKKADAEAELDKKRQRFEELIDVKVGNMVRNRIFKLAAEKFAEEFAVEGECRLFLPQLLSKLWTTSSYGDDDHTKNKVIRQIVEQWNSEKAEESDSIDYVITGRAIASTFAKWPDDLQKRVLFLFIHGNKGGMYWDKYQPQIDVKELAEEYGLDYRLIDAECRLEFAQEKKKKYVDEFKKYLDDVRAGKKNAKIPRVHSPNWNPKD